MGIFRCALLHSEYAAPKTFISSLLIQNRGLCPTSISCKQKFRKWRLQASIIPLESPCPCHSQPANANSLVIENSLLISRSIKNRKIRKILMQRLKNFQPLLLNQNHKEKTRELLSI